MYVIGHCDVLLDDAVVTGSPFLPEDPVVFGTAGNPTGSPDSFHSNE